MCTNLKSKKNTGQRNGALAASCRHHSAGAGAEAGTKTSHQQLLEQSA